jgi:acetolactate synthase I/II/III large subunit
MRVADYIINKIYDNGTDTIFSVSGRGALFLTDAVAKHKKIRNVAVHHEQSAAFASVAYAQFTGKLGACLVSTGCASTNAITGVLSAWQDNLPCIFISGQNILNETSNFTGLKIRTFGQQEADIIPIIKSITKYSAMLHKGSDIVEELDKAIYYAMEGRQGPVWLDIPLDLQSANVDVELPLPKVEIVKKVYSINDNDISNLMNKLINAKRPVVLIGSGVRSASAEESLRLFIESQNIPLVYSNSAPDIYGTKNKLSIGSIGSMGASRAGNFCLQNSDLVLILGNRLSTYSTGVDFCDFARDAEKIVVDIDPIEHTKNGIKIDQLLEIDIDLLLTKLNKKGFSCNVTDWVNKCLHWKNIFSVVEQSFLNSDKIDLYELTVVLSKVLPEKCSLVTDSGFIEVIVPTNFNFGNSQRSIHPISQGAMGFALPGAIGTHFASNQPVFVVVGDGSVMMNLQELQTIIHNQIPVKIIIINNNVYGIIRRRQSELFRGRVIGVDPNNGVSCPNFEKLALAFGLKYQLIEKKESLELSLKQLVETEGPVICEIICREDQSYIEVGTVRDQNKKMVRRPLEDQTPFLDRELFLSEMIINPIKQ